MFQLVQQTVVMEKCKKNLYTQVGEGRRGRKEGREGGKEEGEGGKGTIYCKYYRVHSTQLQTCS